ncbi:hypothetical protein GGI42DRAFT_230068 [Trichoderma sp. SZMC 28013]
MTKGRWKASGREADGQSAKPQNAKGRKMPKAARASGVKRPRCAIPPVQCPAAGLCSVVVCFISSPSYCYARLVVSSCHVCRLARCPAAARHEISQSNGVQEGGLPLGGFLLITVDLFSALVADSLRIGHSSCTAALSPTKGPNVCSANSEASARSPAFALCTAAARCPSALAVLQRRNMTACHAAKCHIAAPLGQWNRKTFFVCLLCPAQLSVSSAFQSHGRVAGISPFSFAIPPAPTKERAGAASKVLQPRQTTSNCSAFCHQLTWLVYRTCTSTQTLP